MCTRRWTPALHAFTQLSPLFQYCLTGFSIQVHSIKLWARRKSPLTFLLFLQFSIFLVFQCQHWLVKSHQQFFFHWNCVSCKFTSKVSVNFNYGHGLVLYIEFLCWSLIWEELRNSPSMHKLIIPLNWRYFWIPV